jgi:hypothetical protein
MEDYGEGSSGSGAEGSPELCQPGAEEAKHDGQQPLVRSAADGVSGVPYDEAVFSESVQPRELGGAESRPLSNGHAEEDALSIDVGGSAPSAGTHITEGRSGDGPEIPVEAEIVAIEVMPEAVAAVAGSETVEGETDFPAGNAASLLDLGGIVLTKSAAACVEKARDIARLLNHTRVKAAHLILAMTLDEDISRKMQKDFDVDQARRAMLRRLGEAEWHYDDTAGKGKPPQIGRDLADVFAAAAAEANERDQEVSLFDLFRGFEAVTSESALLKDGDGARKNEAPVVAACVAEMLQPQLRELLLLQRTEISEEIMRRLEMLIPAFAREIAYRLRDDAETMDSELGSPTSVIPMPPPAKPEGRIARTLGSLFS